MENDKLLLQNLCRDKQLCVVFFGAFDVSGDSVRHEDYCISLVSDFSKRKITKHLTVSKYAKIRTKC